MLLVTGASGFLGKHVMKALSDEGIDATPMRGSRTTLYYPDALDEVFKRDLYDTVIHLAAACGGITANAKTPADYLRDNVQIALNIFEACRVNKIKHLICAGSVCAYSDVPVPFERSDLWYGRPNKSNRAYGEAKRMLVSLADAYKTQYGLDTSVLHLANMYGPGDNLGPSGHVVAHVLQKCMQAENGGTVVLMGSGKATRDFLYVEDAADAFVRSMECVGDWNAGTGEETSIARLAEMCASICQKDIKFNWDTLKPDGQVRRAVGLDREFHWRPKTELKEGLRKTYEWLQNQPG
jgi:GDP-L-fucose synthase